MRFCFLLGESYQINMRAKAKIIILYVARSKYSTS